jgi:hypothetical protein
VQDVLPLLQVLLPGAARIGVGWMQLPRGCKRKSGATESGQLQLELLGVTEQQQKQVVQLSWVLAGVHSWVQQREQRKQYGSIHDHSRDAFILSRNIRAGSGSCWM